MSDELKKKVERAITLIQSAGKMAEKAGQPLEIAYSAGKDSDTILELAKMSGVNYRAIYKNTTIDVPGTISHAIARGAEILRPKKTFFQMMETHGWPSRRVRWCCKAFKEYKVLDYVVIGVRREESRKRAERYKEPEVCRVYSKTENVRQYLPILDWTTDEVAEFLKERNVKCSPVYYDADGTFHPERRLGCLCCPLASKKHRLREFEKYPKMVKAYLGGVKYFYKITMLGRIRSIFTMSMNGSCAISSAILSRSSGSVSGRTFSAVVLIAKSF